MNKLITIMMILAVAASCCAGSSHDVAKEEVRTDSLLIGDGSDSLRAFFAECGRQFYSGHTVDTLDRKQAFMLLEQVYRDLKPQTRTSRIYGEYNFFRQIYQNRDRFFPDMTVNMAEDTDTTMREKSADESVKFSLEAYLVSGEGLVFNALIRYDSRNYWWVLIYLTKKEGRWSIDGGYAREA